MGLGIDATKKDLTYLSNFNIELDEYLKSKFKSKFMGSNDFFKKQIASLFSIYNSNDFKSKDFGKVFAKDFSDDFISYLPKLSKSKLPNIDFDLIESPKSMKNLNFKDLSMKPFRSREKNDNQENNFNLIKPLVSNSFLIPLVPMESNNLYDNLPRLNSNLDLVSNANIKSNMLYSDIFKYLNVNAASKTRLNMLPGDFDFKTKGGSVLGINDVTYNKSETQKIKSMLASTGKFDTQVDINDFILKTAGFKSLLFNDQQKSVTDMPKMFFEMVNLASNFKDKQKPNGNDDAVSVVYKLFNDDILSPLKNQLTKSFATIKEKRTDYIKGSLGNSLGAPLGGAASDLFSILMLQFGTKLDVMLKDFNLKKIIGWNSDEEKFEDAEQDVVDKTSLKIEPEANLETNLDLDSLKFNDVCNDLNVILVEIRDSIKQVCGMDLERNVVDPLSVYFNNVENAINALSDAIIRNSQGGSFGSNINDSKIGNAISRIP
ncbi:Hypothetical protein BCD_1308 (plasmid) [Borrelia crocidurae DOU]|uniref:Uncharacterized protein n=1 Tax=Borrelia crocidurae DOU TaxID=1293575 RepID=W5SJT1_9SPIR|nr:hypothetical protein [Borrelia crocidurae]AHH07374.1 Hypothetical protein BCD_1308 [Borrelia crocidurae DOU]